MRDFEPTRLPRKGESFQTMCQQKMQQAKTKGAALDGLYQSLDVYFNNWRMDKQQLKAVMEYIKNRNKEIN